MVNDPTMRRLDPMRGEGLGLAVENRPRTTRALVRALVLVLLVATTSVARADEAPPGVAAPNLRFGLHYDFLRQQKTDTYSAITAGNLGIGLHEGHNTRAELVGVTPIAE